MEDFAQQMRWLVGLRPGQQGVAFSGGPDAKRLDHYTPNLGMGIRPVPASDSGIRAVQALRSNTAHATKLHTRDCTASIPLIPNMTEY